MYYNCGVANKAKTPFHYLMCLLLQVCKNWSWFLLTFFSERELTFTFAICYRLSIRLSSVTFVRPTQTVQIFRNISTALGTLAIHWKFHGDRPRETPPPGELKTRGVAKCSDFEPIDGYISETVQDRR